MRRSGAPALWLLAVACVGIASAVHYDLSHLTEPEDQWVIGPIQDDEALLLYSIVRGMRLQTILEVGGKSGYSAKNFIRAIAHTRSPDAKVYTVDIFPVPKQGDNHVVLTKNASLISAADVENKHIDLLFFDCHEIGAQIDLYGQLQKAGLLTDETVIVVHDTNLYYYPQPDGTVLARAHQAVEREMVNWLKAQGYDVFSIRTSPRRHSDRFPRRHGISILQKWDRMINPPDPPEEARDKGASWENVDFERAERDVATMLRALGAAAGKPAGAAQEAPPGCAPAGATSAAAVTGGLKGLSLRGTQLVHTALLFAVGIAVTGPFWAQPLVR